MATQVGRRSFLGQSARLAAGVVAAGGVAPSWVTRVEAAAPVQPSVARIGLQLYTIGDQIRDNVDKALESVARIGYRFVEFAGYGDEKPEQIRATLDRLHLKAPSTHIALTAIREDFETQAHIAEVLGHEYITVPSLGNDMPTTADGWKKMADEFNALGTRFKARKVGLAFHSHRDEYADMGGGKKGLDIFITGTDPALVTFEMDLGWARVAGQNPTEWFTRYPGRFKMWHVKDILALQDAQAQEAGRLREISSGQMANQAPGPARGGPPPEGRGGRGNATPAVTGGPVPVGAGEIDYKPIFARWKVSGLEYFFVEQDGAANWPGGSLVAIATSYRNLVNLLS
jgi:sugar phosphate isomerase/epimerase